MGADTQEFGSLDLHFSTIKLKKGIQHTSWELGDSDKSSHHTSDNTCIGISVTTLLDGKPGCSIKCIFSTWFVWLVLKQEVKGQDHGFLEPPLLLCAIQVFHDQFLVLLRLFSITFGAVDI